MGATVHPHSLAARGSTAGAAVLRAACASSGIRINPACVAKPPAAAAVAKKPKRPGPFHEGPPPQAKRARSEVQPDAGTKIKGCPAGQPLRKGVVEALCVTKKNQLAASPEVAAAPAKPPACSSSMRELLERARLAKARSAAAPVPAADADAKDVCGRWREIELRRAQARREIELVVRTVEFNDPFIDLQDTFK